MTDRFQDKSISNQFRPAILQTFGDIAQAIGPHFETYLSVVAQVLQSAAGVNMGDNAAFEMLDYVISLREGIMDAWSGAILAMRKEKCTYLYPSLLVLLTFFSTIVDAVRRVNIRSVECHRPRPKPK